MVFDFSDKRVLVAGGTGLIGIPLVKLLIERGAFVRIVSMDDASRAHPCAEFIQLDLLSPDNCLRACDGMDYVFNLLCIKGSPVAVNARPATFFDSNLLLDINPLRAAYVCGVSGYLLASSLAVYSPAEIFYEADVWKSSPSENDRFAGWAKRMGELQTEAYRIEYGWNKISIVRPANTYGPYDDFESESAMVVPSLIRRVVHGENPLRVWGDGSEVRDFIHARDVARGMLFVAEHGINQPVNLGSGTGVSIKELTELVISGIAKKPEVIWDLSRASGDKKRILNTERAKSIGFEPSISLEEGIKETTEWYQKNKGAKHTRFDAFYTPH